jgi:hypothetical protein
MAGRPQYIVDHFDEFLDNYNAHSLSIATADTLSTIKWLAGKRLLRNSYLCEKCQNPCSLSVYNQGLDG